MILIKHSLNNQQIAEVQADDYIWKTVEDGTDVMGDVYYQGFDRMIIHEKNIHPDFFDLKTKMAGEILQKFSTYRVRLIIVGDFSKYNSQSLRDFISESNKGRLVNFVESVDQAKIKLAE